MKASRRELKVSRKVVRKVIRSGGTAFVYDRTVQPPAEVGAVAGGAATASDGERGAGERDG